MQRHKIMSWAGLCLAALIWGALPALAQDTPEIAGSLSNFDVTNLDRRAEYNDFELYLIGRLDPRCIQGWYPGWGAPPQVSSGTPFGPGLTVQWSDRQDPIGFSRTEHFGLRIGCPGRFDVRGFWSIDGRPVQEVPLPWQFWQPRPGMVWDVIRLSPEFDGRVAVRREFTTLPEPIALDDLNWDQVDEIVRGSNRKWKTERRAVPLKAGERVALEIPSAPGDAAVVVRYTVEWRNQVVSRFVNAAILAAIGPLCPSNLPDPVLAVTGTDDYETSGGAFTRYNLSVTNRASYPDALFAPAPDLPPCGANPNSARTWVDIDDDDGVRLYRFCALAQSDDLGGIWFARPRGTPPPECVTVTLNDRRCNQSYTSNCATTAGLGPDCVQFEGPAPGTTYNVGAAFVNAGATIRVENFQWSNGTWTGSGFARIGNAGLAGASGQELEVNNVNLRFDFPVEANVVYLNFGEYGGNLNLEINGDFQNFENFAQIGGSTIGGASVSVTNGFGNDQGTLTVSGEVNTFAIGGQELVIDRVCATARPGVDASGVWVLPYRVGGTRLDLIQPDGLLDYGTINDAPFGGNLGFQMRRASIIPTADFYYYRFQYRAGTSGDFQDFTAPVSVSYIREDPVLPPAFPTLPLGPVDVAGKNLYRFRPHPSELPALVPLGPGQTAKWATGGNVYRGFLHTVAKNLAPGPYQIKLEVYDQAGNVVTPGPATFRFAVPTGQLADGTVTSAFVPAAELDGNGMVFTLHVDNRPTNAVIDEPMIAGVGAGGCGFLRFTPAEPPPAPVPPPVEIAFHATHPADHAYFGFRIVRGPTTVSGTQVGGVEVAAAGAGPYVGDGSGNFDASFGAEALLEGCPEGAFAEVLNVYAKATNGWSRIDGYDSSAVRAFALTPED